VLSPDNGDAAAGEAGCMSSADAESVSRLHASTDAAVEPSLFLRAVAANVQAGKKVFFPPAVFRSACLELTPPLGHRLTNRRAARQGSIPASGTW
jgi:hypothetical protein